MKNLIVTVIATLLFSTLAMATDKVQALNEGTQLAGRVLETINGVKQPVPFAYVYCEGTTISAYTNENGEFSLPVAKSGKYILRFSHAGYAVVEKSVKVKKHSTKVDCSINRQDVLLTAL